MPNPDLEILATSVGELNFKTPVLSASGTFGNGMEYQDFFDLNLIGGIVTKSVSANAVTGNPPPRIAETPAGMLNAIGLQNEGVEFFCRELLPPLKGIDTKVIVNVAGHSETDYITVVERLQQEKRVDALEINVSCPNVKQGGMAFGLCPETCCRLLSDLRRRSDKPLWAKLSPNVTDISVIARAAEQAGVEALVIANTLLGMAVDVKNRRPLLAHITGGLSGPAIFPVALRLVWQCCQAVKIPVVGVGGISSLDDILAMILCGASAVEIGTMNLVEPDIVPRLTSELQQWLTVNRESITTLRGSLKIPGGE